MAKASGEVFRAVRGLARHMYGNKSNSLSKWSARRLAFFDRLRQGMRRLGPLALFVSLLCMYFPRENDLANFLTQGLFILTLSCFFICYDCNRNSGYQRCNKRKIQEVAIMDWAGIIIWGFVIILTLLCSIQWWVNTHR
jgi:uncharacterized membrane protein